MGVISGWRLKHYMKEIKRNILKLFLSFFFDCAKSSSFSVGRLFLHLIIGSRRVICLFDDILSHSLDSRLKTHLALDAAVELQQDTYPVDEIICFQFTRYKISM